MKKLLLCLLALLFVFSFIQTGYTRSFYKSYKVVEIRNEGLVVSNTRGDLFFIADEDRDGISPGDIIRYDSGRHRLKKSSWQSAVIVVVDRTAIILELNNGEKLETGMLYKYKGKFKQGDRVLYKKSTGQIKESSFPEPAVE